MKYKYLFIPATTIDHRARSPIRPIRLSRTLNMPYKTRKKNISYIFSSIHVKLFENFLSNTERSYYFDKFWQTSSWYSIFWWKGLGINANDNFMMDFHREIFFLDFFRFRQSFFFRTLPPKKCFIFYLCRFGGVWRRPLHLIPADGRMGGYLYNL